MRGWSWGLGSLVAPSTSGDEDGSVGVDVVAQSEEAESHHMHLLNKKLIALTDELAVLRTGGTSASSTAKSQDSSADESEGPMCSMTLRLPQRYFDPVTEVSENPAAVISFLRDALCSLVLEVQELRVRSKERTVGEEAGGDAAEVREELERAKIRLQDLEVESEGHLQALEAKAEQETQLRKQLRIYEEKSQALQDDLAQGSSYIESLRGERDELEAKMAKMQAEVEELRAVSSRCEELEAMVAAKSAEVRALSDESASFMATIAAKQEMISSQSVELKQLQEDVERLQAHNEELEQARQRAESESEGHLSLLQVKQAAAAETQLRLGELERELAAERNGRSELSAQVDILKAQLEEKAGDAEVHQELIKVRSEALRMQGEIRELYVERDRLRLRAGEFEEASQVTAERLQNASTEVFMLRSQLKVEQEKVQELEQENEGHLQAMAAKQRETINVSGQLDSLRTKLEQKEALLTDSSAQLASLTDALKVSEANTEKVERMNEEKQQIAGEIENARKRADALATENEALQRDLASKTADFEQEMTGHLQAVSSMQSMIDSQAAQIDDLQHQVREKRDLIVELQVNIEQLQAENQNLLSLVDVKQQAQAALQQESERLKGEMASMQLRIANLGNVEDLQVQVAELSKRNLELSAAEEQAARLAEALALEKERADGLQA
eukprot:RCo039504